MDNLRPRDSLLVPFLVTSLVFLRVGITSGAFECEESESELEPDEEEDEGELLEEDDERVELGRFVGSDGFLGVLLVGLSVIWSTKIKKKFVSHDLGGKIRQILLFAFLLLSNSHFGHCHLHLVSCLASSFFRLRHEM